MTDLQLDLERALTITSQELGITLRRDTALVAPGPAQIGQEGGLGGGGVTVERPEFPRSYCWRLCFQFPSRVLISWSCRLAGRRVARLNAERSASCWEAGRQGASSEVVRLE